MAVAITTRGHYYKDLSSWDHFLDKGHCTFNGPVSVHVKANSVLVILCSHALTYGNDSLAFSSSCMQTADSPMNCRDTRSGMRCNMGS